MSYQLKNFKTFNGMEGVGFNATLHGPAGKVADCNDYGDGGVLHYRFASPAEEAKFAAWAKTYLADKTDCDGKPYELATMREAAIVETALFKMSLVLEEEKQLAKEAKKGIAYFVKDSASADGKALYGTSAAYTPQNVAKLREKYGADLLEIVNERLNMPFVDAATHDIAEQNKRYRRRCRTTTFFTLKDSTGQVKVMKVPHPYSAAVAKQLRAKYPDLVEIINERFL